MYDYNFLTDDIMNLTEKYSFLKYEVIGKTVQGRKIYTLSFGRGKKEVYYNGAHHGLEWLTSKLLVEFLYDICDSYKNNKKILSYNIRDMFEECTLYITPMVNPDGVEISKSIPCWQANANGVDLNHNYNANWRKGKRLIKKLGIDMPGPTKFSGKFPECEPESRAVADFTRKHKFQYVIAFHSQGEVIYWKYGKKIPKNSYELAKKMSVCSGYKLDETTKSESYSGYKDWFIDNFKKPGYTIEIGLGKNPITEELLDGIYSKTLEVMLLCNAQK